VRRHLDAQAVRRARWVSLTAWALAGALLCAFAWSEQGSLALLVMVPVLWGLARDRADAFAFICGCVWWDSVALLQGVWRFVDSPQEGWAAAATWVAAGVLAAGLWAVCHPGAQRTPAFAFPKILVLQLLLLLPPLWLLGFFHPLLGWADLLPGWGTGGLALGALVTMGLAWACRWAWPRSGGRPVVGLALVTLTAALLWRGYADSQEGRGGGVPSIAAVQTRLPPLSQLNWAQAIDRPAQLAVLVEAVIRQRPDLRVLVFPEGAIGDLPRRAEAVFEVELVAVARRHGVQLLLGGEFSDAGRRHAGVLSVEPGGSLRWHAARQPMPALLWRPWSSSGHPARWQEDPIVRLLDGRSAYLSQCVEDVLPGFFVQAIHASMRRFGTKPDLVVSVANGWWMPTQRLQRRQERAVAAMARLYGLPLVRAVNLPPVGQHERVLFEDGS